MSDKKKKTASLKSGGGLVRVFFSNVQGVGSGVKLPHIAARTIRF